MNDVTLILGCSLIALVTSFLFVLSVAVLLEKLPTTVNAGRNTSRGDRRVT